MPVNNLILLAMGVVFLGIGTAIVLTRNQLAKLIGDLQRSYFGQTGKSVARHATPAWTLTVGCFFVALGALAVMSAIFLKTYP